MLLFTVVHVIYGAVIERTLTLRPLFMVVNVIYGMVIKQPCTLMLLFTVVNAVSGMVIEGLCTLMPLFLVVNVIYGMVIERAFMIVNVIYERPGANSHVELRIHRMPGFGGRPPASSCRGRAWLHSSSTCPPAGHVRLTLFAGRLLPSPFFILFLPGHTAQFSMAFRRRRLVLFAVLQAAGLSGDLPRTCLPHPAPCADSFDAEPAICRAAPRSSPWRSADGGWYYTPCCEQLVCLGICPGPVRHPSTVC